ncbi:unnamed protein product [Bursaphelenchus okinawaensis]|uniref:Zinc finger PHD-type domain-containing protein n=1 Tax=Bursaphelenchus okinawaensis TaxID=465554 RepID=A0A811KSY2_9BILA|nr:unnamed protein product [Bursaphelenchus okinawaensis]CAG9109349.1 unnamed protein product [Bursaphelenchus okinawaensis]
MKSSESKSPSENTPTTIDDNPRPSSSEGTLKDFIFELEDEEDINMPVLRKDRAIPKQNKFFKKDKSDDWNLKFLSPTAESGEKRTNRRNRNKCETCGQGGLIYCCDGCPSVFHATCHWPRIQGNKKEAFFCRKCKILQNLANDSEGFKYKQRSEENDESIPKFFHEMCVKMLTVKEQPFTLPKSVTDQVIKIPKIWPGDQLVNTRKKRPDQENDCYVCRRPVIFPYYNKCYFCPLVVHLDCQLEPEAARRIYAWRCPCHVENFIDRKFVKTQSLVERTKMYQKYGSIDHNVDQYEVLRRCALKLALESEGPLESSFDTMDEDSETIDTNDMVYDADYETETDLASKSTAVGEKTVSQMDVDEKTLSNSEGGDKTISIDEVDERTISNVEVDEKNISTGRGERSKSKDSQCTTIEAAEILVTLKSS